MWSGFCGDIIRKTNQRLLIVVLILAAGLIFFFGYNHAYFYGFFRGPQAVSQNQLLAAKDAGAFADSFLIVNGGATAGTGLYETTTDKTHPEGYISARYLATEIGGKKLLVRVSPELPLAQDRANGDASATAFMTLTGHVTPLTSNLSATLAAATAAGDEEYLPYLLDVYEYKIFGWISIVIGGFFLALTLWGAGVYFSRNSDPAKDSFARALAKYGPLASVVPQVDAEMMSVHTTVARRANAVHVGQQWLVAVQPFRAYGARLDGLVWAYRLIVKRKMYGVITVGTRHTLLLYDRYGQKIAVQLDEPKTAELLQLLRNISPQAIFGYDKRLLKIWRAGTGADRTGFITEAQALLAGQVLPEVVTRKQFNA
jgi:hypothetical protein